jgi:Oxidoreductase family, NAD-binding Rossmann fold
MSDAWFVCGTRRGSECQYRLCCNATLASFQNVMLALHAGKHVLCEKAFTVNAAQAKLLYETAKEKSLFLMEAVWTLDSILTPQHSGEGINPAGRDRRGTASNSGH